MKYIKYRRVDLLIVSVKRSRRENVMGKQNENKSIPHLISEHLLHAKHCPGLTKGERCKAQL